MKIRMRPSDIDIKEFCRVYSQYCEISFDSIVGTICDLIELCVRADNRWINFTVSTFNYHMYMTSIWNRSNIGWLLNYDSCSISVSEEYNYLKIVGTDDNYYYIYRFTDKFYKLLIPFWKMSKGDIE